MRIVGGRWRGRRLRPPDDRRVRPTADRVREAWISIMLPDLPEARVLDLYAGTGALGLEALSRGAAVAHFVESSEKILRVLRSNIAALGAEDQSRVHKADALRFIGRLEAGEYDVAFADPPYTHSAAAAVADAWLRVPFASVVGIEHRFGDSLPAGGDTRRYGDSAITFYRVV